LLYFCAEISLYYSAAIVGGGTRFDFVTGEVYPRGLATLLILTLLVFEMCAINNYIELSNQALPAVYQKKERIAKSAFPQRHQVSLPAFSSHYMLNAKEGI